MICLQCASCFGTVVADGCSMINVVAHLDDETQKSQMAEFFGFFAQKFNYVVDLPKK